MTRLSSATVARIAPPWAPTRRGSPSGGARTIASSPRTKAAVRPRKCAPTMPPSIAIGRVRRRPKLCRCRLRPSFIPPSLRPGRGAMAPRQPIGSCAASEALRRVALFGDAALEPLGDHFAGQVAANENDAAVARLAGFPWPLMITVENHVHALEDKALVVVFERENAFAAQNVRAFLLHQVLHPGEEFVGIERLV